MKVVPAAPNTIRWVCRCPGCNNLVVVAWGYCNFHTDGWVERFIRKDLGLNFNEYQKRAHALAFYPENRAIEYIGLKLAGEAGEVAEKVGKMIRDGMPDEFHQELSKELGDVLWYVQEMAGVIGYSLQEIAELNINKLESRKQRGVLGGSGDNR